MFTPNLAKSSYIIAFADNSCHGPLWRLVSLSNDIYNFYNQQMSIVLKPQKKCNLITYNYYKNDLLKSNSLTY